jgi:hypothetical protein
VCADGDKLEDDIVNVCDAYVRPDGAHARTKNTLPPTSNSSSKVELVKPEILVFHTSILCVWGVVGRKSFDLFERDKCD